MFLLIFQDEKLLLIFQDEKLKEVVDRVGSFDWKLVASQFSDRSDLQCQHRWYKVLSPELIKGAWTKEVISTSKNCKIITFLKKINHNCFC